MFLVSYFWYHLISGERKFAYFVRDLIMAIQNATTVMLAKNRVGVFITLHPAKREDMLSSGENEVIVISKHANKKNFAFDSWKAPWRMNMGYTFYSEYGSGNCYVPWSWRAISEKRNEK